MFIELDGDKELARAVDVVMAQAKRIYILRIKVNRLFSFFSLWCFLKEIENMFFVFLSSYTNTRESLGELFCFIVFPIDMYTCSKRKLGSYTAVTKSGTGTWDLGREDSGTPGRGTRGQGDVGRGDAGTRGRGTRGRGDVGTRDVGTWGREDVGLGDAGREDVINKKHPNDPLHLSLLKYQVRGPNLRLQHAKLIPFM